MSKKLAIILGLVVVLAAAGGTAWHFWGDSGDGMAASAAAAPKSGFEIKPEDRTMGNRHAKVVLIEYAALTCPHCAAFDQQILPQVKKNYIDTGKVFYVFRLIPRMAEDGAGEKMARCLPKNEYFKMVELLFQNQPHWDPEFGVLDVHGGLMQVARLAGMSSEQADKCIADTRDDARINQVATEAETRYGLTGTPTFVINGIAQPSGGLPYADLARLLDQAAKH